MTTQTQSSSEKQVSSNGSNKEQTCSIQHEYMNAASRHPDLLPYFLPQLTPPLANTLTPTLTPNLTPTFQIMSPATPKSSWLMAITWHTGERVWCVDGGVFV